MFVNEPKLFLIHLALGGWAISLSAYEIILTFDGNIR